MWSNLPFELLANVFSFLSPESLACAKSACRSWHTCSNSYHTASCHSPAWFVALPMRNRGLCYYAHNPILDDWHMISLGFSSDTIRLICSIGSLLLLRPTNSTQLSLCNPFTRQFRQLPMLNITRTNPAVGVVLLIDSSHQNATFPHFKIYVAGGMSEAPHGGARYEPTVEIYDSGSDTWQIVGSMPVEFAVRLTVWTPNESVYSNGILYWITSARAYSVICFEIVSSNWKELSVPMADRLEFATLLGRNGRVTLVGGAWEGNACIWELGEGDLWGVIEKVPIELGKIFLEEKGSTKCVGSDGEVCLYKDLGSGMIICRKVGDDGDWKWSWIKGCSIKDKEMKNLPIKGAFLRPNLSSCYILTNESS